MQTQSCYFSLITFLFWLFLFNKNGITVQWPVYVYSASPSRSCVREKRSWRGPPCSRSLKRSCWSVGSSSWRSVRSTCWRESSTSSSSSSTRTSPTSRRGKANLSAPASNSRTETASASRRVSEHNLLVCSAWKSQTRQTWVGSLPFADFQHKITVQASPSMDKRRSLHSTSSSPPSSPTLIPRLRAIQRKPNFLWLKGFGVPLPRAIIILIAHFLWEVGTWEKRDVICCDKRSAERSRARTQSASCLNSLILFLVVHQRPCNSYKFF